MRHLRWERVTEPIPFVPFLNPIHATPLPGVFFWTCALFFPCGHASPGSNPDSGGGDPTFQSPRCGLAKEEVCILRLDGWWSTLVAKRNTKWESLLSNKKNGRLSRTKVLRMFWLRIWFAELAVNLVNLGGWQKARETSILEYPHWGLSYGQSHSTRVRAQPAAFLPSSWTPPTDLFW